MAYIYDMRTGKRITNSITMEDMSIDMMLLCCGYYVDLGSGKIYDLNGNAIDADYSSLAIKYE